MKREAALSVALDLRLSGYRGGGIARYASELSTALMQVDGLRVRALRSRNDREHCAALRCWTPPHHRLERYTLGVDLLFNRFLPDLYHATDFIAPRLPSVPIVATVHDLAFLSHPAELRPDALRYYRQLATARRWTRHWIVPSAWTASELSRAYDIEPTRISVIPHGVSLGLGLEQPLQREERAGFLLAIGTVEPRKRYDLLLDAFTRLHPNTGARLVVVGRRGWNAESTELRLRTTPGVTWHESLDDDALRQLYRAAIALAIPSRVEGFGLPALEAMAAGTPVISSGGGALAEVHGSAAIVPANPDDALAWVAAVEGLLGDPSGWHQLSATGQAHAQSFTWQRAAEATARVYRQVLGA